MNNDRHGQTGQDQGPAVERRRSAIEINFDILFLAVTKNFHILRDWALGSVQRAQIRPVATRSDEDGRTEMRLKAAEAIKGA